MNSKLCLSILLLLCVFSFNQAQAEELTATDFEQIDILFPIENEETRITLSADDTVIDSEEEAVSPGESGNGEIGENGENGSTDPGSDIVCYDTNCSKCTTTFIGTCTECKTGFEAVGGMCQTPTDPNTPAPTIKARLSVLMRWNGNLALVEKLGGKPFIRAKLAQGLGLSVAEVNVTEVTYGSIIVAFDLFTLSSSTLTTAQLKSIVDTYGNKKDDKLDIFGEGIMDYYGSKIVVTAGGCPSGYYADASNICQPCKDGCETCDSDGKCSKTKVGAIVGGILGGLALIMVIVVLVVKRDVIFKGLSSPKSANRAAYYAAQSPVSPTEQAHLNTENQV